MSTRGKVVKYPVLQQQLIDARDQLDREVALLRRMHDFSIRALVASDFDSFSNAVAEAIVDIFELEFGIFWPLNNDGRPLGAPGILGITVPALSLMSIGRALAAHIHDDDAVKRLSAAELAPLNLVASVESAVVGVCRDSRGRPVAMALGGVSRHGAAFFGSMAREVEEAFAVFTSQLGALIANQRSSAMIDTLNRDLIAILQAIPDPMFELDEEGRFVHVWPGDQQLLADEGAALLGRRVDDVFPADAAEAIVQCCREARDNGFSHGRQLVLALNGARRWFELSLSRREQSSGGCHFMVLSRDITDRKESERQLRESEDRILHQASFDALTKLPNRLLVLNQLEALVANPEAAQASVAVLVIDLDDFKRVNDSLGHDMGDKILVEAAARLQHVASHSRTVGRLGGDEFIILIEDVSSARAASGEAAAALAQFRRPFQIEGREVMITASGGLAMFPSDGAHSGDLLRKADVAMYHAKARGKNKHALFTDTLDRDVERRLAIEEQLRRALDREELSVAYQPKLRLADQRIVGVEALLRWHNAVLGTVSPGEFIPIAEQMGLISSLGTYILEESIRQVAIWRRTLGLDLQVAVNLSPRQFHDNQLLLRLKLALDRHGLPARALELEITEGILINKDENLDALLAQLSILGVRLAMDDFGTGYSSLSYLRSYPFDVIKIDQSFIGDITTDAADSELVSAAIAMGKSLGMDVVAEGIEDTAQLELLREKGCDFGQGYLFSPPVFASELETLLIQDQ